MSLNAAEPAGDPSRQQQKPKRKKKVAQKGHWGVRYASAIVVMLVLLYTWGHFFLDYGDGRGWITGFAALILPLVMIRFRLRH